MRYYFLFLILSKVLISCQKDYEDKIDVSGISVDFNVERFDVDFYQSTSDNLQQTKIKYPFLFPKDVADSIWIQKIADQEEQELFSETQKIYRDFSPLENELDTFFKYVTYYNPNFNPPNVVTVLSNIDYEYRIIYSDSLLLISLDAYLGSTHPYYNDYPDYIKENNRSERILVDVANKLIEKQIRRSSNRTFIGKMIDTGKKLYLLDLYLPSKPDIFKIGYSKEKIQWAQENEEQVWRYFIEENLLYSTDTKLNKRFLENAPFSKFYLSEDVRSPGKIGQWVGWQIVRAFMRENDVSLQELLDMDEDEVFKKSNYKPRK